jgi:hypothetical protein
MKKQINWLPLPEEHDYPAAASYLLLIYNKPTVERWIAQLRDVPVMLFKAKDIFRASRLSLLGVSNSHVKKNFAKIKSGKSLSPLLLVRDADTGKVVIADGYHRLCTVYDLDEDAVIPCQIVG